MFKAKKPCKDCPFRKDSLGGWLGRSRAKDIIETLKNDGHFLCHKHVDYSDESFSEENEDMKKTYKVKATDQFCAGALLLMQKEELLSANVLTRMGMMGIFGDDKLYPEKLTGGDLIFHESEEFISHHMHNWDK